MATEKQITILHIRSRFQGDYPLFNQVILGLNEGYRHIVCYLCGPNQAADEELSRLGYDVRWLPFVKGDLKKIRFQVVKELDLIIKKERIDLIHAHRHKATVYAALAVRRNKKVCLVTSVHGQNRSRTFSRKLVNFLLWPLINKIIAVSQAVKDDIIATNFNINPAKISVVHNGIETTKFFQQEGDKAENRRYFSLPADRWLWGALGRLVPTKGYDILLKAWAEKKIGSLGGFLVFAGKGREQQNLLNLANDLGIEKEICFLGHVSEVPKFLQSLDGYVMPSRNEGFPLARFGFRVAGGCRQGRRDSGNS
jgi:glycosyltransferase involved in cell wall biosynthesis